MCIIMCVLFLMLCRNEKINTLIDGILSASTLLALVYTLNAKINAKITCNSEFDPQGAGPVGQRAGEAEETQRPLVETPGTDPGPAGRTPRSRYNSGVCVCVCVCVYSRAKTQAKNRRCPGYRSVMHERPTLFKSSLGGKMSNVLSWPEKNGYNIVKSEWWVYVLYMLFREDCVWCVCVCVCVCTELTRAVQPEGRACFIVNLNATRLKTPKGKLHCVLHLAGYWPSYNVPFHVEIYNLSGYGAMWSRYGEDFSYDLCPSQNPPQGPGQGVGPEVPQTRHEIQQ